jgi:hypothetical protein
MSDGIIIRHSYNKLEETPMKRILASAAVLAMISTYVWQQPGVLPSLGLNSLDKPLTAAYPPPTRIGLNCDLGGCQAPPANA